MLRLSTEQRTVGIKYVMPSESVESGLSAVMRQLDDVASVTDRSVVESLAEFITVSVGIISGSEQLSPYREAIASSSSEVKGTRLIDCYARCFYECIRLIEETHADIFRLLLVKARYRGARSARKLMGRGITYEAGTPRVDVEEKGNVREWREGISWIVESDDRTLMEVNALNMAIRGKHGIAVFREKSDSTARCVFRCGFDGETFMQNVTGCQRTLELLKERKRRIHEANTVAVDAFL